ncbi:protein-glutamate O-methyltransferase CheR [Clostridium subterminale]|uniref:protein-glutamate O-methyltransferase n=1 Tax=Clostridium subterminale TaxID=1550 RepID=A0ABN1KIH2_CLOSU
MDFTKFENFVLREFKLDLSGYKSAQLHRRILTIMSRTGAKDLDEYMVLIKKDKVIREKFLDYVTINVTEFYRNPQIFEELQNFIKSELPYNRPLKIWSAACSIGAEPYSISMMLKEMTPSVRHKILATDIDTNILLKAKAGEYISGDVKNIPKYQFHKYFKCEGEKFIINKEVKDLVTFKKHDLILDSYEDGFDIIVCRNVVIYFTNEVKEKIYEKFSRALNPGGLLFIGATESIYGYKNFGFEKLSTFIYKKI